MKTCDFSSERKYFMTVECVSPTFTEQIIRKAYTYGMSTFVGITEMTADDIDCIHKAELLGAKFQNGEHTGVEQFNLKYFPHLSPEFTFNEETANSPTLSDRAMQVELNFVVQKITFSSHDEEHKTLCQIAVCEEPSNASIEAFFEENGGIMADGNGEEDFVPPAVSSKRFLN